MTPTFRIAAIPGDGIGKEVLPEGLRVLNAAAERFGFALEIRQIEWASCDWYARHGQMMPVVMKSQWEPDNQHGRSHFDLIELGDEMIRCKG